MDYDEATVAAIVAKKRAELLATQNTTSKDASDSKPSTTLAPSTVNAGRESQSRPVTDGEAQEAADQAQGAYNPDTGEINWDCPCLGGMANGPCGEEFKTAFSCFIFSEVEPKGMDCIDKFQ